MTHDEKLRLLPALRGSSANCLLTLLVAERPLPEKEIVIINGLSKPSVRSGLALLESLRLVVKQTNGWTLSAVGFALLSSSDQAADDLAKKFFTPTTTTTDPVSLSEEEQQQKQASQGKIFNLLKLAGVGVNSSKMHALLEANFDVAYVEQHVLAREKMLALGEEYRPGLLIRRLEDGDPAPPIPVCTCGQCDECFDRLRAKYPGIQR